MPKTCIKCKHWKRLDYHFGECKRFNWKIRMELAKKQAVCKEYDVHHIFPQGMKVPIPLYERKKVSL